MEFAAEIHVVGLTDEQFTVMAEVLQDEFGVFPQEPSFWQGDEHLLAEDVIAELNKRIAPPSQMVGTDDGEIVTFAGAATSLNEMLDRQKICVLARCVSDVEEDELV